MKVATIITVAVHELSPAAEVTNPGGREVVVSVSDGSRTYRTPHRIIVSRDRTFVGESSGAWPGAPGIAACRDIALLATAVDHAVREALADGVNEEHEIARRMRGQ